MMRNRRGGFLLKLVLVLIVLKILVVLLEPHAAFFPSHGVQRTPRDLGLAFQDLHLQTADGQTIHAWWLPHDRPRAAIVYFHGNGGNLSLWLDAYGALHEQGWSVLAFDYRGYGASTGTPSERGLYRDTDAVLTHFNASLRTPGVPVIYWGRSLGGTPAAYAAAKHAPAGVILEGAFPSMVSLFGRNPLMLALSVFSAYSFPTARYLREYTGRVLVVHGEADSVIPFRQGQKLFDAIQSPKQFHRIPGGDHNDFHPTGVAEYWAPIKRFVEADR
jgi:fermentation-respiration switch protein FrsA (DUF1100 family)